MAIVSHTGFAKNAFKQSDVSKIRIAAVVNSKIISTRDLNDRIKLLSFISKIDAKIIKSVDFRKRVLEQLVDEELEDQEIIRRVQKGVNSRLYEHGRFSPEMEKGVHHFHTLIRRFMESKL